MAGQPVFVMARPDGRQVWVNFAVPDYDRVQVIDTPASAWWTRCGPGKAVLHMEFTPRGDAVWISCRDDHLVRVIDTATRQTLATLAVDAPAASSSPRAPSAWGSDMQAVPDPAAPALGSTGFNPARAAPVAAQRVAARLSAVRRALCRGGRGAGFICSAGAAGLPPAGARRRAQPHWGGVCAG